MSHTYADALQVRAEAALLAGRALAARAVGTAGADPVRRPRQRPPSRSRIAAGPAGRAGWGLAPGRDRRARLLAGRPAAPARPPGRRPHRRPGGRPRADRDPGQLERAERIAASQGPPGRIDRLDTRLLWRLTRAEALHRGPAPRPRPPGSWPRAWRRCTGTAPSSAASTCRPAPPFTVRTWPGPQWPGHSPAGHRPRFTGGQNGPGPRRCCSRRYGRPTIPPRRRRWRSCARSGIRCAPRSWPGGQQAACGPGWRRWSARYASTAGPSRGIRGAAEPAPAPFSAVQEALGEAALIIYLRDGPALRALVVAGGSASLVTLGERQRRQADAVLRLRADLDARGGPGPAAPAGRRRRRGDRARRPHGQRYRARLLSSA